ncbi:MAG: phage holin family protein [Gemmatimonadota bacterium]|nr:MAG: phage holin family protein [Gemmatimonadota bacterium]
MIEFLVHLVLTALLLLVVARIVPGVSVSGFGSALIAALILGLVNALVRPLVVVVTIPITIVTLGLFLLVINGLMFLLASKFVSGFRVEGCLPAFLGSLVFSILNLAVSAAFGL